MAKGKGTDTDKAVKTRVQGYVGLFSLKNVRPNDKHDLAVVERIIRESPPQGQSRSGE